MEFYNVLVQVRFPPSKNKLDIEYNKPGIGVASQAAEQLKTLDLRKLENCGKISNLGGNIALRPVSLPDIKIWRSQSKGTQK